MEHVVYLFSILIWILCPIIIGLILLQGAAGDISSSFGGGGMLDSTLGVGAHRKMAKATGILALVFFLMVLVLAFYHPKGSYEKVVSELPAAAPAPTPPKHAPAPATAAAPTPATVAEAVPATVAAALPAAPATVAAAVPAPATAAAPEAAPAPATVAVPAPATTAVPGPQ